MNEIEWFLFDGIVVVMYLQPGIARVRVFFVLNLFGRPAFY